jgi:hypothetical protein
MEYLVTILRNHHVLLLAQYRQAPPFTNSSIYPPYMDGDEETEIDYEMGLIRMRSNRIRNGRINSFAT